MTRVVSRPLRHLLAAVLAVVVVQGVPCPAAGADLPDGAGGGAAEPLQRVLAEEATLDRRVLTTARVRFGYPLRASAGLTTVIGRLPAAWECETTCRLRGPIVRVEPGLAGLQVNAGYGSIIGETRSPHRFVREVFVGWSLEGAVLRTWGDSPIEPDSRTYVGAEAAFTITRVNFTLGAMRRLEGGTAHDRWLVTGGIGLGF